MISYSTMGRGDGVLEDVELSLLMLDAVVFRWKTGSVVDESQLSLCAVWRRR